MHTFHRRELLAWAANSALAIAARHTLARSAYATSQVVSVADFGALPNGSDAGPGVQKAIQQLPSRGGSILQFPPGIYRFGQRGNYVMDVRGIEHFELRGRGATFLFEGTPGPIKIVNCPGALLQGFTIDWKRPPFSQGEVIEVEPTGTVALVLVDPEHPVDGSEHIKALATYDREKNIMAVNGIDAGDVVGKIARVGDQRLRLEFKRPLSLRTGDTLVMRHEVYAANGITIDHCSDLRLMDITIHAAPGMAISGLGCRNVSVQNIRVVPPPGSRRLMSTTADGIHLTSCSGKVDIRNCLLGGMGDDCVNVQGTYLRVQSIIDARTITVSRRDSRPFSTKDLIPAKDKVNFEAATTLEPLGHAYIAESKAGPSETLRLKNNLAPAIRPGDYLIDVDESPSLVVADCTFPGNRARGVLAHSDAIVERCRFANQFEEAVLLLADAWWMEGPSADRVSVKNNVIEGVERAKRASGAIRVGAVVVDSSGSSQPSVGFVNHDVDIVENTIRGSYSAAIYATATTRIRIEQNRIEGSDDQHAIVMDHVKDALVEGNTCRPAAALKITKSEGIKTKGNQGLVLLAT
jgi:hypothetical protein